MTDKTEEKSKGGRPKGSRNKSTLMKAQMLIDDNSLEFVLNMMALAKNDKEHFGMTNDIPASVMLSAGKILLDKAIANEKDKEGAKSTKEESKGVVGLSTPKVFAKAK